MDAFRCARVSCLCRALVAVFDGVSPDPLAALEQVLTGLMSYPYLDGIPTTASDLGLPAGAGAGAGAGEGRA